MSLDAPVVSVQVVRFIEVLTVFAWGAKVELRAGDVTFTANCDVPGPSVDLLSAEADQLVAAQFVPGRALRVQLSLYDASSDHTVTPLDGKVLPAIHEKAQLDWEVYGTTTSEVDDEESVLMDCGVPMLAFWPGEAMPKGTAACWTGEIRAYVLE